MNSIEKIKSLSIWSKDINIKPLEGGSVEAAMIDPYTLMAHTIQRTNALVHRNRTIKVTVFPMMSTRRSCTRRRVVDMRDTGRINPPLLPSYFPKTGRSEKSHIELNIVEAMAEGFRDHTPNAMLTKDIDR